MNLSTHSLFTKSHSILYKRKIFSHIQRSSGPDKDLTPPETTKIFAIKISALASKLLYRRKFKNL